MSFSIDPLEAKSARSDEVAQSAIKREISNILDSYVGWFDPFSELIQNALDAIDERIQLEEEFLGTVRIIIDQVANSIIVSDNGIGLTKDKFEKFLAPSFSFKSGKTRGHKGVGATYLAYGFNEIQVSTIHPEFNACGKMIDARKWLDDPSPAGNPKLELDKSGPADAAFDDQDRGVSVKLKFDKYTKPSKLAWLNARTAEQWFKILSIKTGLGSVPSRSDIKVEVTVVDVDGNETDYEHQGISYYFPHNELRKTKNISDIIAKQESLYRKNGPEYRMPSGFKNLDAIYYSGGFNEIESVFQLAEDEIEFIEKYNLYMYVGYFYTAKIWAKINEKLEIRSGVNVFSYGIQVAANNMPQGELFDVPLTKNTGRLRQLHFVFHLENVRSDLGRKGFQKEIVEFLQEFANRFYRNFVLKFHKYLKATTGSQVELGRTQNVEDWKKEFEDHEKSDPLNLVHESFFLPKRKVSITSIPTREQDVIALFNQLIAGGVIRGIEVMSTNERFTYDGMFRIVFGHDENQIIYDRDDNPLGVDEENWRADFRSGPRILEYKLDLDGLIEDIENESKNTNDIDLVVVWSVGKEFEANFQITSFLNEENIGDRPYHGVTHTVFGAGTGQREFDLIALEDLIGYLNDTDKEYDRQLEKYDPD